MYTFVSCLSLVLFLAGLWITIQTCKVTEGIYRIIFAITASLLLLCVALAPNLLLIPDDKQIEEETRTIAEDLCYKFEGTLTDEDGVLTCKIKVVD